MDSNGKLVTRHVKAVPAAGAPGQLPPPAAASNGDPEDRRKEALIAEICGSLPRLYPNREMVLEWLPLDTVEAVRRVIDHAPAVRECITEMVNSGKIADPDYEERLVPLCVLSLPFAVDLHASLDPTQDPTFIPMSLINAAVLGGFNKGTRPLTTREQRAFKAHYFAEAAKLYPHGNPEMVRRLADRLDEIQPSLPVLGAVLQNGNEETTEEDIYGALDALREADVDLRRLRDFILDRRLTDVRAAAEALRGVAGPLQDGAL